MQSAMEYCVHTSMLVCLSMNALLSGGWLVGVAVGVAAGVVVSVADVMVKGATLPGRYLHTSLVR